MNVHFAALFYKRKMEGIKFSYQSLVNEGFCRVKNAKNETDFGRFHG
jgi:hypothetical protein